MVLSKSTLREEIKSKRESISEDAKISKEKAVAEKIFSADFFKQAEFIAFYHPLRSELDLSIVWEESLKANKRIFFPKVKQENRSLSLYEVFDISNDLEECAFHVLEPKSHCPEIAISKIDLIFVPGIAFDLRGGRLGYGAGYYDHTLMGLTDARKVGVGFSEQLVPEVPMEQHDIFLDEVILG